MMVCGRQGWANAAVVRGADCCEGCLGEAVTRPNMRFVPTKTRTNLLLAEPDMVFQGSRRHLLAGKQGECSNVSPNRCVLVFRSRCCGDCNRGNDIVNGRAISRTGRPPIIRKRSVGGCEELGHNRTHRPPQEYSLSSE